MTSLIGQTLNKRYHLDALLGDGGMGTVYRASDLNLERQVHSTLQIEAALDAARKQEAQRDRQYRHDDEDSAFQRAEHVRVSLR